MQGNNVIAKILKAEGVEFLACFPANTLIDQAAREGIRPIISRQERTGVNIADGFSRVKNGKTIGVFAMQQGPGAENAFGGVAQAFADSVPILLLPGGHAKDSVGVPPAFESAQQYRGITKWAGHVNTVERIPELMARAFSQLKHGRLGPVLLEIPTDVATDEFPGNGFDYTPVEPFLSQANPEDVRDLVAAMLKAACPVINVGQGVLYVIRDRGNEAEILSRVDLEGLCLGSPAAWNGKVYVHTKKKLYCFGERRPAAVASSKPAARQARTRAVRLQVVPHDVMMRPGEKVAFTLLALDAAGRVVRKVPADQAKWTPHFPPLGPRRVPMKSRLDATVNARGELVAAAGARPSFGLYKVTAGGLTGDVRGRILPRLPYRVDFEGSRLPLTSRKDGTRFAHPPAQWIWAKLKWDVREVGGSKVLAKTLDRVLFQRVMTFIGHPDERNYTMEADIMSRFRDLLKLPYGVIIVCGPTGAGKSSTLYASILQMNRNEQNVMSLED
ncbi:MAG: Flp pilus assembly complex ATPase component TadA, partial [Chloroflexi bacterium]|nr:Flp pilus assembly complex ATPase component TadA [Chloroflexota bacterium]